MGDRVLYKNYELDMTGLACPMPIVKLKKFLAEHPGESLEIDFKASDKGAMKDVPAFCRQQGLDCLFKKEDQGFLYFKLTKS
ncbi:hypothetical protein HVMH_0744 [Hydrogenovibrio marinus]|nr:hypothetical protein HVMH_0744 [Hydrogenovibrio marinus]